MFHYGGYLKACDWYQWGLNISAINSSDVVGKYEPKITFWLVIFIYDIHSVKLILLQIVRKVKHFHGSIYDVAIE